MSDWTPIPSWEGIYEAHPDGRNDGDVTNNAADNLRYDTRSENNRDMARHGTHRLAARTHCAHGHEYTPENTRLRPHGARLCITCARQRGAAYMRRKRAAAKGVAA